MSFSSDSITEVRAEVLTILQDEAGLSFPGTEIDASLRLALVQLAAAAPRSRITVLTLMDDGTSISLSDYSAVLPGIAPQPLIDGVCWPWNNSLSYDLQRNQLAGYFIEDDEGGSRLVLVPRQGRPLSGEQVRLRYTMARTISGLDGAQVTTLFEDELVQVVHAASGYTAQHGSIDRAESDVQRLVRFSAGKLQAWNTWLRAQRLRTAVRSQMPVRYGWEAPL